jgi:hypothetical protein
MSLGIDTDITYKGFMWDHISYIHEIMYIIIIYIITNEYL